MSCVMILNVWMDLHGFVTVVQSYLLTMSCSKIIKYVYTRIPNQLLHVLVTKQRAGSLN